MTRPATAAAAASERPSSTDLYISTRRLYDIKPGHIRHLDACPRAVMKHRPCTCGAEVLREAARTLRAGETR